VASDIPWTAVVGVAVAASALAATLVSFAWQTMIWKWSGSRPKVSASPGAAFGGGAPPQILVFIEARNKGRGACQITQAFFATRTGMKIVALHPLPGSAALPMTLEGQHAAKWMFDAHEVRATARQQGVDELRPVVTKGSGELCCGAWSGLDQLLHTKK